MIVAWLAPVAIVAGVVFLFKTYVIYVLVVQIVIIVKYAHLVNLLLLKQGGAFYG